MPVLLSRSAQSTANQERVTYARPTAAELKQIVREEREDANRQPHVRMIEHEGADTRPFEHEHREPRIEELETVTVWIITPTTALKRGDVFRSKRDGVTTVLLTNNDRVYARGVSFHTGQIKSVYKRITVTRPQNQSEAVA